MICYLLLVKRQFDASNGNIPNVFLKTCAAVLITILWLLFRVSFQMSIFSDNWKVVFVEQVPRKGKRNVWTISIKTSKFGLNVGVSQGCISSLFSSKRIHSFTEGSSLHNRYPYSKVISESASSVVSVSSEETLVNFIAEKSILKFNKPKKRGVSQHYYDW